jgi:8-oxo-dGTP diphosphatase
MPLSDQGVNRERYMLIPRTAIFLRRGDAYLLLKGAPTKRLWANKYNGLGGHIERGENISTAAKRELLEESGLSADIWLCGTVIVETGQNPGICLYVFTGESVDGDPQPCSEGLAEWIAYDRLNSLPVVEDLSVLLGRVHAMRKGDPPFAAHSFYDDDDHLIVQFS